ncbi:MAG TPA: TIM barrel protein [Planctomycetota bacterium]|nr:TIM barrel protein [Planctomycetota bacterium]
MKNLSKSTRRQALAAAGTAAASFFVLRNLRADDDKTPAKINGNINQSLCKWCYAKIPFETLGPAAKKFGYKSIELLTPEQYAQVKPFGLTCAMLSGIGSIPKNWNRKENHAELEKKGRELIDFAAAENLPNVITFSGNRDKMPDDEGLENCAEGLKKLMSYAEEKKVTVVMELLNSKVNHPDYMCDHTAWGVKLCKKIGSERFKLLYDIYHMQIMEGDVIRTLKENKDYIAHYHTGGVPGRAEIDEGQELYYPAIMKAILGTKYTGFVAQEFIPKRDPLTSLGQAFKICDV